jgi:2-polyprenyl-3-methyl-5-hydroxy-6-metoxy-1,4-benzoquinol methylase
MTAFDGASYQARFDRLAESGLDVHGEATFVLALHPASVLDAGCGTGRVARELARLGVEVVGVDVDASMVAEARRLSPDIDFVQSDLATLALGRQFDVVVLAGNVPLFCPVENRADLVATSATHVRAGGVFVAGFELGRGYELKSYDAACRGAGLSLLERWSTWDRAPFHSDSTYAVSVHTA